MRFCLERNRASKMVVSRFGRKYARLNLTVRVLSASMILLVFTLSTLAPAADAYVAYSYAGECKIPIYQQGVRATFNTVNPTYVTDSAVAYFIGVFFLDGSWVQVGYLKGWYQVNPHAGYYQATVPTVYVEQSLESGSIVTTFQTLSIGSYHTYTIMRTGVDAYGFWIWSAYVDGVLRCSVQSIYEDAIEIVAEGESHNTLDSSVSKVYFSSLQQYQIDYPRRGAIIYAWHPWDGYSASLCDSWAGWNIVTGSNSFQIWMT